METNVNYTIVGAFVIVLVSAIVFGIIWLSSGFSFEQNTTYQLNMTESVSGLSIDSPVEFNGVEAGNVKSIDLDKKNPQLVIVLIDVKSHTPITMGTVATLKTRGITGFTYIALTDKSTDLRPMLPAPGQLYAIIKTDPSFFVRLDTALSQLSKNFHRLTNSIQELLDPENQLSIKNTLRNLDLITKTIVDNGVRLTTILANTANASQQLGPLLQSSASSVHVLQAQTLPMTYQMLNNLNDASRTLSEVVAEIKRNPSILIRGGGQTAPGPGERK